MKTTGYRFKKYEDGAAAMRTGDYSKAEKVGKKGWRNAMWEIGYIYHPKAIEHLNKKQA